MNANPAFDEVDDYVDALLGGAVETLAAAPAGTLEMSGAVPDAIAEAAVPMAPTGAEAEPASPASAASAEAVPVSRAGTQVPEPIPAAPLQPPATPPPARTQFTPASHRWLRVTVGNGSYALELLCVQEVVRVTPIVAMRGASRAVLGVMNLRGRIVPVFDLGLWLGTACVEPDERSRIVVVERDDELIGVMVTLVEDVVTLSQNRIEPPLPGSVAGPIVGIARVGAVPTVLLDAGTLFG